MSRRLNVKLLDAQTTQNVVGVVGGTGTLGGALSAIAQITEAGIHVEFSAGAAAGVVLVETASDPNYAGTWAILATVNWSAESKSHYVGLTGVYRCIRVRISSAVTGGTVTVWFVGNVGS
jgi:hypothetical protein